MPDVGVHRKGGVRLEALLKRLRKYLGGDSGAIGCFIGVVRARSARGGRVRSLSYEAADDAADRLREIASRVESRKNIERVMIHHIVDSLGPGEDAIYVLVAGRRRADVFKALPDVMDMVKAKVPIWKKEITAKGEYWFHEACGKKIM